MSRKTLMTRIATQNKKDHDETQETLAKTKTVCTMADIWSTKHHGYMGVSCHWLNDNMERRSRVLACQNFKNPHTAERIADVIFSVHENYKIDVGKIISTITDNASNMIKSFKLFGVRLDDEDEEEVVEPDGENEALNDDQLDDDSTSIYLPKHQRCSAHTINLVATTDFKKIVDNSKFRTVHSKAFAKFTQIWNGSRRPKGSEAIGDVIGKQIGYPVPTRWNSLYDCTVELLSHEENLNRLMEATKSPKANLAILNTTEISYLKEYVILMKPLAQGLDFLQGDKNTYYGRLLPTLFSIKSKLEALLFSQDRSQLKIIHDAVPLILEAFKRRFTNELALDDSASVAIIASVSHPYFKLRWLEDDRVTRVTEIFVRAVNKVEQESLTDDGQDFNHQASSSNSIIGDDFLVLRPNVIQIQCNQAVRFLSDQRDDFKSLDSYPAVKEVFKHFNTPLCSSAPIERIFNFAGILNHPKRGSISPENFEKCVIMKGNRVFKREEKF